MDRCIIIDEGPTVVIGDLHLGYECTLEQDGIYLPRINTNSVRDALNDIIYKYEPQRVVILGDIKHSFQRPISEEYNDVRTIISLLSEAAETIVIKGNHDNYLQGMISEFGIEAKNYVDIMGLRLEHGHLDSGKRPVIIGHEHPCIKVPQTIGGGLKIHCFIHAKDDGVIVIPPFSPLQLGNDLTLDKECTMAPALKNSNLSSAKIYGITDFGVVDFGTLKEILNTNREMKALDWYY